MARKVSTWLSGSLSLVNRDSDGTRIDSMIEIDTTDRIKKKDEKRLCYFGANFFEIDYSVERAVAENRISTFHSCRNDGYLCLDKILNA